MEIVVGVMIGVVTLTIGTALGALSARALERRFFPGSSGVPVAGGAAGTYAFLQGHWTEYHLTFSRRVAQNAFWLAGSAELHVEKDHLVTGISRMPNPGQDEVVEYRLTGRIAERGLALTAVCVQYPADFYTLFYPNLLPQKEIVGVMVARDWDGRPFAGVTVLAKRKIDANALNKAAEGADITLAENAPDVRDE